MNPTMKMPTREVAKLLDQFGLAIGASQVEIIDFKKAESGYIHHTQIPVALAGYAIVSPAFGRGRFPNYSFINLIQNRPSMDHIEACALAALCCADIASPIMGNPELFGICLWNIIDRYQLEPFFERVEVPYGGIGDHYLMRPRGFNWNDSACSEITGALAKWRADYKNLPTYRQLLVATVLQLYKCGDDAHWMVRVPKKWHAAQGIEILRDHGALTDWGRLYALYPGW